jgi:F-type H+-transporting ATPase subunit delta
MLADELGEQDQVARDMRLVNAVCSENRVFNVVFHNPEIKMSKKIAIVQDIFAQYVCKTTMAFLEFVVRKSRSVNLNGISASYLDLYRDNHNIVLSKFTTASAVDTTITEIVSKTVARYTGKEVELITKTDPKIIGGFAIEYDNNIYDARLSTKLVKLRQQFDKNVYESKL